MQVQHIELFAHEQIPNLPFEVRSDGDAGDRSIEPQRSGPSETVQTVLYLARARASGGGQNADGMPSGPEFSREMRDVRLDSARIAPVIWRH